MLRRLTVRNLAIVEDLDLELGPGLTVISGETGAGKSILVDALALLSGGRGSVDLVRQGAERLVVSGEFESDRAVRDILEDAGLPCVTHLPQIAALADRHFRAEKKELRGRTIAAVRLLEGRERVDEIARMLAGEKVPETALRHARELLAQAGNT